MEMLGILNGNTVCYMLPQVHIKPMLHYCSLKSITNCGIYEPSQYHVNYHKPITCEH